jgi:hypothetical protein
VEHDDPATKAPVLQAIEELEEQVEQALNKHNKVGVLETGDRQFIQQRVAGQSSKKLNLINKTRVFLMTAARFNRCGRTTSGRLGHTPTLGRI